MVRKFATTLVLSASMLGLPAIMGCDREVSSEKKVTETRDGGVKVQEKTVTEKADGTVEKKTETKKVNP
jgi:hypothetical protein